MTHYWLCSCGYSWGWTESCKTCRVPYQWVNDLLWLCSIPLWGGLCPLFCCYVKHSEFTMQYKSLGGKSSIKSEMLLVELLLALEYNYSARMPLMPVIALHTLFVTSYVKQNTSKHKLYLILKCNFKMVSEQVTLNCHFRYMYRGFCLLNSPGKCWRVEKYVQGGLQNLNTL